MVPVHSFIYALKIVALMNLRQSSRRISQQATWDDRVSIAYYTTLPFVKQWHCSKAALKSPTPQYGSEDEYSDTASDTNSSIHSSSFISMSEPPSSEDSDTLVTRLADINIKTGSSAPGPAPNADELLEDLINKAFKLKVPTQPQPPLYGVFHVSFFESEYDGSTDGPLDTSVKPRGVRVHDGWRCPILPVHPPAYKGCVLSGTRFPNVGILGLHLSRHHPEIEAHWRHIQVRVASFHR